MNINIQKIHDEVSTQLANKEVLASLVATTFKGLEPENVKKAMIEGVMRGFTFEDFLQKNIYAVPYGKSYSLITSIDYARKVGMRSGVVGKSEPVYEEKDGRIISCTITIRKKFGEIIGNFTATAFFSEYTTGKNLWTSKPRTMIAKVAEMHALRMACPEELSQMYMKEEMDEKIINVEEVERIDPIRVQSYGDKLKASKTLEELKSNWSAIPFEAKEKLGALKDELKKKLS
jgi:hypothetical protein